MRTIRGLIALAIFAACLLGLASARAAYPPFGQQRISHMGPDGNVGYIAAEPSVAYNPNADEYLVVWEGTDNAGALNPFEREIYAQRLSQAGVPLGGRTRISEQGPEGDLNFVASAAKVVYNPLGNEYLVVWLGSTSVFNEYEIWGQRLSASGVEIGENNFRISDMGPDGDSNYAALSPSVAVDSATGDYLVLWHGDDDTPPLVNNELEIFGQRLTSAAAPPGTNAFRISEQGADGDTASSGDYGSVAFNPVSNEYAVVWRGEIGTTGEFEIWAQRLSAVGAEVGGRDYQISTS